MNVSTKYKYWFDIFGDLAQLNGFQKIGKGWIVENSDSVIVLDLQKSKYGANYYLNINIFLRGFSEITLGLSGKLVGKVGDIFRRNPPSWDFLFDPVQIENPEEIRGQMESFFEEFLMPFVRNMAAKDSIIEFAEKHPKEVSLLPAVKSFLSTE